MKIPMEIPEAFENATKEIIDFECEAEMVRPYCALRYPFVRFLGFFLQLRHQSS